MGLDALEILFEIEETFGIEIPDEDAAQVVTVGDLHDCVVAHLPPGWKLRKDPPAPDVPTKACLSAATFYELRRELVSVLDLQRGQIRPKTSLETLFPLATRRERWSRWVQASKLKCPALKRHPDVTLGLAALTVSLTVVIGVYLLGISYSLLTLMLSLVICIGVGFVAYYLSLPLATRFEGDLRTVGDLAKDILRRNYLELKSRHGFLRNDDVFEMIRGVLVTQLAIAPELVVPEASLVKDLGME